jgi:hypothetical protein
MIQLSFLRQGLVLLGLLAATLVQAAEVGKVVYLKSGVTVSRNGQAEALRQDAAVRDSDVIVTNATGQVRILFKDGATLSFGSNTRVDLRDFVGAKQNAFSARLRGVARSASDTIRAQNPGGFGGVSPTATAGVPGVDANGKADIVKVEGKIGAGLDYAFQFRMNVTKGVIVDGKLSDDNSDGGKAYRLNLAGNKGEIDEFGWWVSFTEGSVQANGPQGVVTHKNWKATLSGSDALSALKSRASSEGGMQATGFKLQDEKGAVILEYSLTGNRARTTSPSDGMPRLY